MSGELLASVDAQTIVDATGLGAVYALMAVGIGLVFGVLRLVNFAYGQIVMAGAYALAFTSQAGWPVPSLQCHSPSAQQAAPSKQGGLPWLPGCSNGSQQPSQTWPGA